MAGTKAGGLKARDTNKLRHGEDFYRKIGTKGGRNGRTGGFAARVDCDCSLIRGTHHNARCAGYKGGLISRRGPAKRKGVYANTSNN